MLRSAELCRHHSIRTNRSALARGLCILGAASSLALIGCTSELDASSQDVQESSSPTTNASVKVDGVEMKVTSIELWAPDEFDKDHFNAFIRFEGPKMPEGSDLHVVVGAVGVGCSSVNEVWLRPSVDSTAYPDQYTSNSAKCGLEVTSVPKATGEWLTAKVNGTLDALQSWTERKHAKLTASVSVAWEETSYAPPATECVDDATCSATEDCVCSDCDTDAYCSDPGACVNDGECRAFEEGCVCADCKSHPECN